jgi:hypothetical protein
MKTRLYGRNVTDERTSFFYEVRFAFFVLLALMLGMVTQGNAQSCGCDHYILPTDASGSLKIIDWDAGPTGRNVQPGQTICFQATTYLNTVRIKNVNGTATSRITIKNCGGQTVIDNKNDGTSANYTALEITGSEYFILDGTGAPGVQYGIKVNGSEIHGLHITGFSTDFEVRNLEIANTDGCGVNSKTDPGCSNPDISWFTQRNSIFHDNYLHHIGLEGFYVGYTHYPEHHNRCTDSTIVLRAGAQENIKIYNNRLEYIGWDAIQIGAFKTGNAIYGNTIREYATLGYSAHIHAIQLSDNSDQCDVYNNIITPITSAIAGEGHAIASWAERVKFYNNVAVKTGRTAIQMYDESDADGYYHIMNNTVVEPGDVAVSIYSNAPDIRVNNNILIQAQGLYTEVPSSTNGTNNYKATSTSGTGLTSDYHLSSSSPATIQNAGLNLYSFGVTNDFDNQPRPTSGAFDIGADEFISGSKIIKINFRGTDPAPVTAGWNDWFAMPTTTSPAPTFTNLKYTDGTSSNYNLVLTTRFSGANGLGMTGSGIYPSEIMQTNWYVHNNTPTPGVFEVTGLDNTKAYNFKFFGSREDPTGTTNRNTNYTIGTTTVTLNASNNTTQTVNINNVTPTNGKIVVTVKYGTDATFGYLNAMEISEGTGSGASSTAMAAEEPESKNSVTVHPVPFDNKLTLTFTEKVEGKISVLVSDIHGRKYFYRDDYELREGGTIDIDLSASGVPRGLHVIRIQSTSGYNKTFHVVKE